MPQTDSGEVDDIKAGSGYECRVKEICLLIFSAAAAVRARSNSRAVEPPRESIKLDHSNAVLQLVCPELVPLSSSNCASPSGRVSIIICDQADNNDQTIVSDSLIVGTDSFKCWKRRAGLREVEWISWLAITVEDVESFRRRATVARNYQCRLVIAGAGWSSSC